jgi:hypothetical protein
MIRRLAATFVACSIFATAAAAETADATADGSSSGSSASPVEYPRQESAPAAAAAPESSQQPASADKKFVNDGKWHFATIGYVWFAGATGDVDVIGPLKPVKIDFSFGEIFKHLEFPWAIMGAAEARHNRLVILGDLMWVKIGADKNIKIRDRDFLSGSLTTKTALATFEGGWRAVDGEGLKLDLLAGLRLNMSKNSVQVSGPNRSLSGSVNKTWVDPVIGTRALIPLGGKFGMTLYGDLGGIVWGSKISWQTIGTLNYRISSKMTLGAGYRYYKVDYHNGSYLYDMAYHGPIVAFRTDF